jgi:hypothetical protein
MRQTVNGSSGNVGHATPPPGGVARLSPSAGGNRTYETITVLLCGAFPADPRRRTTPALEYRVPALHGKRRLGSAGVPTCPAPAEAGRRSRNRENYSRHCDRVAGKKKGVMTRQTVELLRLADHKAKHKTVYFNRIELSQLLAVYSRYVIRGEWRDYAIDHRDGFALFSIFRHSHESPTFAIMKTAAGKNPGEYALYSGRRKLRTARTVAEILEFLQRKPTLVGAS